MPKYHSILSPSAASRWLTCTAAPLLEKEYPDEESSYAAEGTLAHEIAEQHAKVALDIVKPYRVRKKIERCRTSNLWAPEMDVHGEEYGAYVKEQFEELKENCEDAFAELEVRVDLNPYIKDGFGTADCVLIADETMRVIDFKYGKGVKVEAVNNDQMKLYALGALTKYSALYDIKKIGMTIYQPRLGWTDTWYIPAKDLLKWGSGVVKPQAEEAISGAGKFCPSEEACRFCKARSDCRARAEKFLEVFDENPPELLDQLTNDEIGQVLEKIKGIDTWLTDLRARAIGLLMEGEEVKGWKLVEGRSNRKIVDEKGVATALKAEGFSEDEIYTKKLLTITQIEKLLGKAEASEVLKGFVEKPQGLPTLVPASDKRPPLNTQDQVLQAFDK